MPIKVPLFMQPNFDILYLCVYYNIPSSPAQSIGIAWCHNYEVLIEVPLFMQPNFDIRYLCVR